jgi:hypothetical protein
MNKTASNTIWPASLGLSTVIGSFALACIFPFAAIAALAAITMKPRYGLILVTLVWATNQAIGFFAMNFPWDAQAVGHGIAILLSTLAGYYAARAVRAKITGQIFGSVAALSAAFIVYQVLLRAYAQFGGGAENFSAEIVSAVALNDAIWFAGLIALRFVLSRVTMAKLQAA